MNYHKIYTYFSRSSQGQTLVEVLIAISLSIIIITSMTIAVTTALSNADFSKNQNLATQFAQEGMEIIRQQQGTNYQTLNTLNGRYCLAQTCAAVVSGAGSCGVNPGGISSNCSANLNSNFFIRQVDILPAGSAGAKCVNTVQATVSVLWADGKCPVGTYCHTEQIVSCFSNASAVSIP